jgi:hypothetical protein
MLKLIQQLLKKQEIGQISAGVRDINAINKRLENSLERGKYCLVLALNGALGLEQ